MKHVTSSTRAAQPNLNCLNRTNPPQCVTPRNLFPTPPHLGSTARIKHLVHARSALTFRRPRRGTSLKRQPLRVWTSAFQFLCICINSETQSDTVGHRGTLPHYKSSELGHDAATGGRGRGTSNAVGHVLESRCGTSRTRQPLKGPSRSHTFHNKNLSSVTDPNSGGRPGGS